MSKYSESTPPVDETGGIFPTAAAAAADVLGDDDRVVFGLSKSLP